jgi:hypothetical protein
MADRHLVRRMCGWGRGSPAFHSGVLPEPSLAGPLRLATLPPFSSATIADRADVRQRNYRKFRNIDS